MSLMDHAEELRRRIFVVLAFFIAALIGGFFLAVPVISFLQQAPQAVDMPFHAFRLTDFAGICEFCYDYGPHFNHSGHFISIVVIYLTWFKRK